MSQQSAIYNHRPLQPSAPGQPPPSNAGPQQQPPGGPSATSASIPAVAHFAELLDAAKQEFEQIAGESQILKVQRDDFESRVGGQVNELNIIRQALYELETQHGKIRLQYEQEVSSLRAELQALHQHQQHQQHHPSQPLHPSQPSGLGLSSVPPPPSHASHPPPPQSHPGYPPPPAGPNAPTSAGDPYYPPTKPAPPPYRGAPPHADDAYPPHSHSGKRGRDERSGAGRDDAMQIDQPERERERDVRERERIRESERERDMRERDREAAAAASATRGGKKSKAAAATGAEREQPPPPRPTSTIQQQAAIKGSVPPSSNYDHPATANQPPAQMVPPVTNGPVHGPPPPPGFSRDRDRDQYPPPEESKPAVAERERDQKDRADRPREREQRDRDRMSTVPSSTTSAGAALPPPSTTATPVPVAPTPTPTEQPMSVIAPTSPTARSPNPTQANGSAPTTNGAPPANGSQLTMAALTDLDAEQVPAELKKEGSDWFAIFNPQAQRKLDITLNLSLAHESVVCCVRFSADGKYLATGCNRTAQIYDTKTGAKTCTLNDDSVTKSGDLYIRSVCFSPDGKLLATGAEDKQIRIWDIASRKIIRYFTGHLQEIYSLDFSRNGDVIVSGSGDKTARVWNMETGSHKTLSILEPESVDAGVTSVAISADSRHVAAGSLDTIVRIWDVATGNLVERLRGHLDSVYSVAFTPDGNGLVSGSLDKTLKYWDLGPLLRNPSRTAVLAQGGTVPSGQQPVTKEGGEKGSTCSVAFSGHKDYVLSVAVSPDGAWVVSGSKDRGVQFWDPKTGLTQLMLQGHKNSVISIDLSPVTSAAGGLLASGSGDWMARVWSYTPVP